MSRASLASKPASTSPRTSFRSSSTLRNEHHIERTPPPSQPYRATPPTQACATPAPESVYGSDRGDVPAEAKPIIRYAKELLSRHTLLEEPWPMPESLTVNVRRFWSEANVHLNTNITLINSAKSEVRADQAS